nr:transposase [Streptomyces sp. NBC_00830]WTB35699.1 transposase [Streptomyces sp. NBC_00830]
MWPVAGGTEPRHPVRPRRYTSDTTDEQWQVIAQVLPWPAWLDGYGGRPEEYCRRQIIDAIFYVDDNGCMRCAGLVSVGWRQ